MNMFSSNHLTLPLCLILAVFAALSCAIAAGETQNLQDWNLATEYTFPAVRVTREFYNPNTKQFEDATVGFALRAEGPFLYDPGDSIAETGESGQAHRIIYAGKRFQSGIVDIVKPDWVNASHGWGGNVVVFSTQAPWPVGEKEHEVYARPFSVRYVNAYKVESESHGDAAFWRNNQYVWRISSDHLPDDVFNAEYSINFFHEPPRGSLGDYPRAGVSARLVLLWPDESRYFPAAASTSDANGIVTWVAGVGGVNHALSSAKVAAPAVYMRSSPNNYLLRTFEFPSLETFQGALTVTVVDTNGTPIPSAGVSLNGGLLGDDGRSYQYGSANEQGQVEFQLPRQGSKTGDAQSVTLTLYPQVEVVSPQWWQITQNPVYLSEKWPATLSGELRVGAPSYAGKALSLPTMRLQVMNQAFPGTVIFEQPLEHPVKRYDDYNISDRVFGRDRFWLEMDKSHFNNRHTVRVVFDCPDGKGILVAGEANQTGAGTAPPVHGPFTFEYVTSPDLPADDLDMSALAANEQFMEAVFPGGIQFHHGRPLSPYWSVDAWRRWPRWMHVSRLFRELHLRSITSNAVARHIALVPASLIGAGGLADGARAFTGTPRNPGGFMLAPGAFGGRDHLLIHEFLHTLGLPDLYLNTDTSFPPPSANGWDHRGGGAPTINLPDRIPQAHALMFDAADWAMGQGWPTGQEYSLMWGGVANVLNKEKRDADKNNVPVLVLSGEVRRAESRHTANIDLDPLLVQQGTAFVGVPQDIYAGQKWWVDLVNGAGERLEQGHFRDEDTGVDRYASFILRLPWHESARHIEFHRTVDFPGADTLVQRFSLAENPPAISFAGPGKSTLTDTFEIAWQAEAPDGDDVTCMLLVSEDDGDTWRMLSSNVPAVAPDQFALTLAAEEFPASDAYRFKVIASAGLRSTETVLDGTYAIAGYDPAPRVALPTETLTLQVHKEAPRIALPIVVGNRGRTPLEVAFTSATLPDTLRVETNLTTLRVRPGDENVLLLQLSAVRGDEKWATLKDTGLESLASEVILATNDPDAPEVTVEIIIDFTDAPPAPALLWLRTDPPLSASQPVPVGAPIRFVAHEATGRLDLAGRLLIEALDKGGAAPLLDIEMERDPVRGLYGHSWTPDPETPPGRYGVRVVFQAPDATSGKGVPVHDAVFTLYRPNRPPRFVAPSQYANVIEAVCCDEIVLDYEVTDEDGEPLEVTVLSTPGAGTLSVDENGHQGEIRFSPLQTGVFDLMATVTDPAGASDEVYFRVEITGQPVSLTMQVKPEASVPGTATAEGSVFYTHTPVPIEALPAAGFVFVEWQVEGDALVADPVARNTTVILTGDATVTALFSEADTTGEGESIEGETHWEGEPVGGDGEAPGEGEGADDGHDESDESEGCGGCGPKIKKSLPGRLGDWLLVGIALMSLGLFRSRSDNVQQT